MTEDYTTITETPGTGAPQEQLARQYSRYRYAATFCAHKDVLEVACGAGQGLGYLKKHAKCVVGGDYTADLLSRARSHYADNIPLLRFDAHRLPFQDHSFDVIIFYEAIYYLSHPEQFAAECARVLRPGGTLLICSANKEWVDFNPSPYSTGYLSARELIELLQQHHFQAELQGGFPTQKEAGRDTLVSLLKRLAVALHLVPKTMKGKEFLKRIFFGKLAPLPLEVVDGMVAYTPPEPLPIDIISPQHKVLYAIGRRS